MEMVEIMAKEDTPYILLDPAKGVLEIKGRSYPEHPQAFYGPVFQWINKLKTNDVGQLKVNFGMEYFNTTSFKVIFDMLFELETLENKYGTKVHVSWYYDSNSPDMKEAGTDLSELINLPFEVLEV